MQRKSSKYIDYQCVRCGYESNHKANMRRHFYGKKAICPATKVDIELTEEIKEYILKNRHYPIEDENKGKSNINMYNTLNKFVIKMEFPEKMSCLLNYQSKQLMDVENDLENHFEYRVDRLENDKFRGGYFLSEDDLLNLINNFTKLKSDHLEKFNVFYHKAIKRFSLFRGTSWEEYLEDIGGKEVVSLVKSYFLDFYEKYIIKHLHGHNVRNINRIQLTHHLNIYYRFIAVYDLRPYIYDVEDEEVLGHNLVENNDNYLADRYMKVYVEQKDQLKISEIKRVKRKIIDIIKENTIQNMSIIDKVLTDLLQIDEEFRKQINESYAQK